MRENTQKQPQRKRRETYDWLVPVMVLACICLLALIRPLFTSDPYTRAVSSFEKIDTEQAESKIAKGESFLLYLGRKSCPDCQGFVPDLAAICKEQGVRPFYLDTEDYKTNAALKAFRDRYAVDSVPGLLEVRKGQVTRHDVMESSKGALERLLRDFIQAIA